MEMFFQLKKNIVAVLLIVYKPYVKMFSGHRKLGHNFQKTRYLRLHLRLKIAFLELNLFQHCRNVHKRYTDMFSEHPEF